MSQDLSSALEMVGISDSGMVRGHNEDAIVVLPEFGTVVLADGMGGYNAGEVASGIAVTLMSEGIKTSLKVIPPETPEPMTGAPHAHRMLRNEIERTNLAIYQTAQSQPQCAGMGTTLVAVVFYDNHLTVAHVGDSRLYRLRGDKLSVMTRDHSLLQEQLDSGLITPEEARVSHNRNLVTRAVGVDPQLEPELNDFETEVGDIYLICSDGLNDMVDDDDIALALSSLSGNLQLAATQLITMANDAGGRDNVSVILVKVNQDFATGRGFWSKLFGWLGRPDRHT